MSAFTVVPSVESDRRLIIAYLENRKGMDHDERQMFLEYIALILRPVTVHGDYRPLTAEEINKLARNP